MLTRDVGRKYGDLNAQSHLLQLGAIARSVVMSLGNQGALRSIIASGTSFREDLVMKIFLPLIHVEHLSVNGERMGAKYW